MMLESEWKLAAACFIQTALWQKTSPPRACPQESAGMAMTNVPMDA